MGGRSRAELPGAGEQGSEGGLRSKGSLQGMRGGEGFYNSGSEVGSVTRLGCEQGLQSQSTALWMEEPGSLINLRWPFPNLDKLLWSL